MKTSARYKKLLVFAFAWILAGVMTMTAQIVMPSGFKPSQPSFPIAQQDHIKGGYHVVASVAQRDDVSDIDGLHPSKREVGMTVFAILEKKSYVLLYAGSSATVADDIWQEVTVIATFMRGIPYDKGNLVMHENNLYISKNDYTAPANLVDYTGLPLPDSYWVNLGGASGGDFALKDLTNVERASVVDTLIAKDAVADSAIQDGAVTETKILDGSVTRNKLSSVLAGAGLEFWPDSLAVAVDSTTITYDTPTSGGIVNIKVAQRGIGYEQLKSDNAADGKILSYNAGILDWTSPGDISVDPANMSLGLAKILVGDSTGVAHPSSVGGGLKTIYRNDSVLFFLTKDIIVDSLIDETSVTINTLGAPINPVSFGGQLITNVATPVNGTDAANKAFVETAITDTFAARINDAYDSNKAWQLWSAKKLTDTLASYPVLNASTGELNGAVIPTIKINKTYVVDSLEKILTLGIDLNIDTVIYTGDIAIDEMHNTSYMFVGYDDGSDDTLSYGAHVDTLSVSSLLWKPIDFGQVISVNGETGAVIIDWANLPIVQANVNAKESSLGNAAANQQILTSIGGTRAWVNAGDLVFAFDSLSDVDAADKTAGQILMANGTQWESVAIGGDLQYNAGGFEIKNDAVTLASQTTGNYVDYMDGDSAIKVYLKNGSTAEGAQYGVSVVTDESTLYVWKDSLRVRPGGVKARHLNFRDGNSTGGSNMVLSYAAEDTFKWIQSDQLSVNPNNIPLGNGKIFVGNLSDLATEVDVSGDVSIAAGGATTIQANAVETSMIKDGDVNTDDLADKAVTTAKIADAAVEAIQISDDAVTGAKLNPDVAGAGLKKDLISDSVYVNVDDATIAIVGDVLQVKDNGINTIQIADGGVYGDDLNQMSATPNQHLTWDGSSWIARTDSAIYTGFQDTIGLGAGTVQRAIEALNTSIAGGNSDVLAKVQADSIAIWDKVNADSLALTTVLSAQRSLLLAKIAVDSTYFEAQSDVDSTYFEGQLAAGDAALLAKISADSTYFEGIVDNDSTEIWDKVKADSLALTTVLTAQRSLLLAKIAVDSTYFEAQSDVDSTYFEGKLAAGDAALLAKLSSDSTYFEAQMDVDSTALQNELNASQTGAGLNIDGTYAVNAGANYISTATDLNNADNLLDTQVKANADAVVTEANARSNADVALQAEVDATQTGAGLNADGTFTASSGTNYIGAATTIKNASELLDAQVKTNADAITTGTGAIQTELDATQASAGINADGTFTADATSNYTTTATSLKSADKLLDTQVKLNKDSLVAHNTRLIALADSNIVYRDSINAYGDSITDLRAAVNSVTAGSNSVQSELDASQAGAGLNIDGTYAVNAGANFIDVATSQANADDILDAAIQANLDSIADHRTEIFALSDSAVVYRDSINSLSDSILSLRADMNSLDPLPSQAGASDSVLISDGTNANWAKIRGKNLDISGARTNGYLVSYQDEQFTLQDPSAVTLDPSSITLGNNNILIGSGGVAVGNPIIGDVTVTSDGTNATTEIAANAVGTTEIANTSVTQAKLSLVTPTADAEAATKKYVDDSAAVFRAEIFDIQDSLLVFRDSINAYSDSIVDLRAAIISAGVDNSAELDATQTSAGINADGSFTADATTNYATTATSLKGADKLLDTQIKTNADAIVAETTARSTADGNLQTEVDASQTGAGLNADGTFTADATTNYATTATSLKGADKLLDTQIKANADAITAGNGAVQTELDATQTSAGINADGSFTADATTNYATTATSLKSADKLLDTQIKANADAVVTEATARSNADVALQSEVDASQTGAGLNADGTFTASGGTNYLGAATTVKNATELLDAQVKTNADAITAGTGTVQTELDATQSSAGINADGSFTADATTNYATTATSLKSADKLLDTQIKANTDAIASGTGAVQTELDATQTGAGLGADGTYTANGTANYISGAASLKAADDLLDTQVKANADALAAQTIGGLTNVGAGADTETTGNILVADGDSWEGVAMSGDASITAAGVVTLADDAVKTLKVEDGAITSNKTAASFPGMFSVDAVLTTINQGVVLSNPTLGNTVTLSLPVAGTAAGVSYTVKNVGLGTVAINGNGATIDGIASTDVDVQYGYVTLICDGTNWYKTAEYLPDYFAGVTPGVVQGNKAVVVDGNRDIRNFRQVAVENDGGHESDAFYWGDPDTDGSWKATRTAAGLKFEKRVGGTWQPMMEIE